jgi:hypothetical protein
MLKRLLNCYNMLIPPAYFWILLCNQAYVSTKSIQKRKLLIFQEEYYKGSRSLAHIYRFIFPTILKLAGDDDRVIKDLVIFCPNLFVFWIQQFFCIISKTFDTLKNVSLNQTIK